MFCSEIEVKTINHLGLIAGIIDDTGLEEIINEVVGVDDREIVTAGQVVKAIILNGLGFIAQPLYLFPKFFEDKATEHLLGKGVSANSLNDDKIGRVMDKLYEGGLSSIFLLITLPMVKKYQIRTQFSHLDATSFSVQGQYEYYHLIPSEKLSQEEKEGIPITITKGYSRDHRPDLKQFIMDLIVSGDGGIPLFLRVADGNEQDKAVFGQIAQGYQEMIDFDTMIVGDSALYTEKNLQLMSGTKWLSRVPLSLKEAQEWVNNLDSQNLTKSELDGYSWKEVKSHYAGIPQRWLVVESQQRKESDLKKLSQKIEKEQEKAVKALNSLMKEKFTSPEGATEMANQFAQSLKYHQITAIHLTEVVEKAKKKSKSSPLIKYQLTASLSINQEPVNRLEKRAGRFILATNELEKEQLSEEEMLMKYKEQQVAERGFGFLKDPLFFADSVFLKSPQRVETMAMLMGLCLLIYSLGQRELRRQLSSAKTGLKNQLGKLTDRPTLRWIFQCFQGIHLVFLSGVRQVVNLTEERRLTLSFFPDSCEKYYFSSA
jgi:transposase